MVGSEIDRLHIFYLSFGRDMTALYIGVEPTVEGTVKIIHCVNFIHQIKCRFPQRAAQAKFLDTTKKGRSQLEAALFFYSRLIFVIVARDLFEQIVGVVVGQVGIIQVVAAWLRVVVQHIGTAARAAARSAKFAFCPRE